MTTKLTAKPGYAYRNKRSGKLHSEVVTREPHLFELVKL